MKCQSKASQQTKEGRKKKKDQNQPGQLKISWIHLAKLRGGEILSRIKKKGLQLKFTNNKTKYKSEIY